MDRRRFLGSTIVATSACAVATAAKTTAASSTITEQDVSLAGRVYKTLKIGMVGVEASLAEKFKAVKSVGFDAIELDSPLRFTRTDVDTVKKAIDESELPVDGTVIGSHWKQTHSSPDPTMRETALKDLVDAITQTDAIGGKTVLLVAGHGKDGTPEEINARSIENITKALPIAAKHDITIAIENVWNRMHYDHDGALETQTADRLVQFVDAFNSPLVGMQFDVGNHWKYGSMGDWIRTLGKRIVKLDLKGFLRADGEFKKIGEGDVDWADVRKALQEINFYGYAAAEVKGGNLERLKEISSNVDKAMGLS